MPDDVRSIPRSGWLRPVLFHVGGPMCRRLFRLRVEGDEHLPAAGGAIIAANHLSFFDSVALALAVPRPLRFVGKAEYLDSWKTRRLFPALGMIPVDRDSPRKAYGALRAAARVLEADELFAVYPEGTRSQDGSLHDGHNGVGHLSMTTGASVIPAGIVGTERIQPRGARLPRPFRSAVVRFGPPIDPQGYDGSRRDRRRHITLDVMSAISRLSGQSYPGGLAASSIRDRSAPLG
jgi:1-acyl-sn-glycerol-3-phosphate acyltransferase